MRSRHTVNHPAPAQLADNELIGVLRDMPVPQPDAGYERRVLRAVLDSQQARNKRPAWFFQPTRWPVAAAAIMLLTLVFSQGALRERSPMAGQAWAPVGQTPHTVHVVLDSPRQLRGAIIRVTLPAGAVLEGYRDVDTLQWQADIPAGGNRLSLPLLVQEGISGGTVQVEIEHGGARKALEISIPSPPDGGGASITKT
ncbi:hypothetical protein [Microbulbifer sp. YPW16]|uniref:hypothetical protein n=1 Tax=unclassified Microbulbifer TaxID=2619833 RepID=UPI001E436409|nr:hypothetical protein [Microbulbifer sp. YPW16]UHQ54300.1 hypothetical protein LVE68_12330 [Microbulbifer sp. YPW16]